MSAERCLPPETLLGIASELLRRNGADQEVSDLVAESLLGANLRGIDSHGIMRLPGYLELIRCGSIDPTARPELIRQTDSVAVFDGRRSFGQLAARTATLAAVEKAGRGGIAAATVSAVQHVGRLGEFGELAAEAGCIALIFANSGPPGGLVAPYGGRERRLGTNPLAFAIPAAERPAVVVDFSTASATDGRIRLMLDAGQPVPAGWLIDADGKSTLEPGDLYEGGALLPAAGHKGFGLSLLVEILGGVLAGEGCASTGQDPGNGFAIIVLEPSGFTSSPFQTLVDGVIQSVEACPPAEGFDRVMVPGGPEAEMTAARRVSGIPVADQTWEALRGEAGRAGVDLNRFVSRN